jgi:LAS superfamily LD-carboxypeptidase LdcB
MLSLARISRRCLHRLARQRLCWDIAKPIRHASPPRYSQHTIAGQAAIDFRNIDGSPSSDTLEGFKDTVKYAWLRQHGEEFSFYESWPEGNKYGMRAEPWHWQYRSSN